MKIKYKGIYYETGNEYHGVIELWLNKKLHHLVKKKRNGVYFKWYK